MNLQQSIRRILKEETLKETVRGMVKTHGLRMAAKIIGSLDEVYEILDLKGTKDDMIFLIKSIMEHEAKEEFDYCSYNIVPSTHYITLYVYIPKPLPEHEGRWAFDESVRYRVEELVSMLLSKLGGGLIRGHYIYVYNTGDC